MTGPGPESRWPPECLAAERKFSVPAAKLYPLLNHQVLTPEGPGPDRRVATFYELSDILFHVGIKYPG